MPIVIIRPGPRFKPDTARMRGRRVAGVLLMKYLRALLVMELGSVANIDLYRR